MKKFLFIIISLVILTGCSSVATKLGYEKKEKIENQIIQLRKEKDMALEEQAKKINQAKDDYYKQLKDNFQNSINWTYGASLASNLKTNKTRIDELLDYRLNTALRYGPPPSSDAIVEQNRLLKEELDEVRITTEMLSKRYLDKEKEAAVAKASELEKENTISALKEKEIQILKNKQSEIDAWQEKLNKTNTDIQNLQNEKINNDANNQALKKIIIICLLVGGAACAVGAYFFRAWELAVGAMVCTGLALIYPFIKPWMVISAMGAVTIFVGIIIYKKFHEEKIMANGAMGTIQEHRNESEESYKTTLKPKLEEWFKNMPKFHKKIEERLKELNLK